MTAHSNLLLALVTIGLLASVGCQSLTSSAANGGSSSTVAAEKPAGHRGPEVEVVRNGVLAQYDSTTVGKAFEGTFQHPQWTSFETPKGATVVQFEGTVMPDALATANLYSYQSRAAVRSRCVESLGLKSKMEQQAQAAQKAEQQYSATMQAIEERRKSAQWSGRYAEVEDLIKERLATAAANDESVKAQKELTDDNEAKIEPCMSVTVIPVRFQFLLSADKKKFEIKYMDQQVFGENEEKALEFIYR